MTLHDGMHKVGGVSLKMRPVRRGILNKLVVPNPNRHEVSKRKHRAGCACVSEQALGRGVCMWLYVVVQRAVQAGVATGQVACMGSFHDLLRETVVGT